MKRAMIVLVVVSLAIGCATDVQVAEEDVQATEGVAEEKAEKVTLKDALPKGKARVLMGWWDVREAEKKFVVTFIVKDVDDRAYEVVLDYVTPLWHATELNKLVEKVESRQTDVYVEFKVPEDYRHMNVRATSLVDVQGGSIHLRGESFYRPLLHFTETAQSTLDM